MFAHCLLILNLHLWNNLRPSSFLQILNWVTLFLIFAIKASLWLIFISFPKVWSNCPNFNRFTKLCTFAYNLEIVSYCCCLLDFCYNSIVLRCVYYYFIFLVANHFPSILAESTQEYYYTLTSDEFISYSLEIYWTLLNVN